MLDPKTLEEFGAKISALLANSPAKDIEKNVRMLLSGAFTRLDLVTRDEFDVQQEVLQRTREKLIILEAKVSELEAKLSHAMQKSSNAESQHVHEGSDKSHH